MGKVTKQHIEWIKNLIPKMILGEVNIKEAMEIVNKNAVENSLPEISRESIRRYSFKLLEGNIEKQEQLEYAIKHNSGNRSSISIERNRPEVISEVLEQDLPLIMDRKVTLKEVANKHHISTKYIRGIIEDELSKNEEEFNRYKEAVKRNGGTSPEKRMISSRKKSRVQSFETVTNKEYLGLSSEEKKKQLIYKYLKMRMSEKENAKISNEESVEKRINDIVEYFEDRNEREHRREHKKADNDQSKDISEEDVLYMLYRVPSLLNYSIDEKINPSIELLDNYEGIGYENTNHILRTFPSVIGYSMERKSKQLKVLSKGNVVDAIVNNPRIFMNSPQLLYAQIQYAKDRNHITDLSNINRNNIFMAGSTMLRLYGITLDEIKERYPLGEKTAESPLKNREIELASLEAEEKTIAETEALIEKQKEKEGQDIGED